MNELKLFMVILGCTPAGRLTEQHDIFFGIGRSLRELIPQMEASWNEAGELHIDAWREIKMVDNYAVHITEKANAAANTAKEQLFFINLGGYKENEFEEYHYKIITAAAGKGEAVRKSKETAFYKHCGFRGAESHIDDRYGIDVDDFYQVEDALPPGTKEKYTINLSVVSDWEPDKLHIGYLKIEKLQNINL